MFLSLVNPAAARADPARMRHLDCNGPLPACPAQRCVGRKSVLAHWGLVCRLLTQQHFLKTGRVSSSRDLCQGGTEVETNKQTDEVRGGPHKKEKDSETERNTRTHMYTHTYTRTDTEGDVH